MHRPGFEPRKCTLLAAIWSKGLNMIETLPEGDAPETSPLWLVTLQQTDSFILALFSGTYSGRSLENLQ